MCINSRPCACGCLSPCRCLLQAIKQDSSEVRHQTGKYGSVARAMLVAVAASTSCKQRIPNADRPLLLCCKVIRTSAPCCPPTSPSRRAAQRIPNADKAAKLYLYSRQDFQTSPHYPPRPPGELICRKGSVAVMQINQDFHTLLPTHLDLQASCAACPCSCCGCGCHACHHHASAPAAAPCHAACPCPCR